MREEAIVKELLKLKKEENYRTLKLNERKGINFSSNDYLGLNEDKELRVEFFEKFQGVDLLFSSSSSRLLTGSYPIIMNLEKELEIIYNKKALLFNSGYDANTCLIETLFSKNSLIISDRYNHSSIYSGIKASEAKLLRYRHLDYTQLENFLKKYSSEYEDILVVSEAVYSMDGDRADIKKIVELKKKYKFKLLIDEAHSFGVSGYGECYETGVLDAIDYLVIPLGKAGASIGAYVLTDELSKEYLINKGKKFIYTTALPPINVAWNFFILKKMQEFESRRENLVKLSIYTKKLLSEYRIQTISTTNIISVVVGENRKVNIISENLREKGYLVYPIKEPTVPKGTARLRISLTAYHSKEIIYKFVKELKNEIDSIL
ncbi:aminotransferase class I/II-fold pyridoxal phosphate-dependent enzyme [Cetobacterium sp.]|uniref:aminotransferase class I/II-fold pyridoxal phosphate-dependent enzyme n=1 Tax=Cetobacterium sp. TaxID=2071632 RepID=UPI003F3E077A